MITKLQRIILRLAFRQARKLEQTNLLVFIQSIPTPNDFQNHTYYPSLQAFLISSNMSLPKRYHSYIWSRLLTGSAIKGIIKNIVRSKTQEISLDDEFVGLRFMSEQIQLANMSSFSVTKNVRFVCTTIYDKQNSNTSDTFESIYYYRITIENCSQDPVQLLARSWKFYAGDQIIEVPKYSPGVIGIKPILQPGESFQYMSSTALPLEEGSMEGMFLMVNLRKSEHFEAPVALCKLKPTNFFP